VLPYREVVAYSQTVHVGEPRRSNSSSSSSSLTGEKKSRAQKGGAGLAAHRRRRCRGRMGRRTCSRASRGLPSRPGTFLLSVRAAAPQPASQRQRQRQPRDSKQMSLARGTVGGAHRRVAAHVLARPFARRTRGAGLAGCLRLDELSHEGRQWRCQARASRGREASEGEDYHAAGRHERIE
jgi:hypothetical protein